MSVREDLLQFLRDPSTFAGAAADPEVWLAALDEVSRLISERNDWPLRPAQEAAWRGLADRRVGLILGPPGTGKTHLLSWFIAGYAKARRQRARSACSFVSAFTRNAIGNVLDAVAERQKGTSAPRPIYYGAPPDAGLSDRVRLLRPGDEDELVAELATGEAVVGATVWSLYRLLTSPAVTNSDGPTAPLFDLACIDEASQMVLGHGLMALAGLSPEGRVIVAGDDQQLPPVRAMRETRVEGRDVGGSLYAFLKSARVDEFALEETFRLNAPLTIFPERRFYKDRYRSAAPENRLQLSDNWKENLDPLARSALDPAFPIVVMVHDGPPAATANSFEADLTAQLVAALADKALNDEGEAVGPAEFWSKTAAVVSPHRAHNAAIRRILPDQLREDAFVETVDRIQGKERNAIILSYCVSDPEFALAEASFIFSPERLNVATTRARFKLVVIISRRLLEAVPSDQELMDDAEVLREFVYSCPAQFNIEVDAAGRRVPVEVRARGFDNSTEVFDTTPAAPPAQATPIEMTPALEGVLKSIRHAAASNAHGSPTLPQVCRQSPLTEGQIFEHSRLLHHLGWVSLNQISGPHGKFWVVRPFDTQRRVFACDPDTVRARIHAVIREARSNRHAFYDNVRDRFAWMSTSRADTLFPIVQALEAEGAIELYRTQGDALALRSRTQLREERPAPVGASAPPLADEDHAILNALEDLEAERINFGVFETWTSGRDLARIAGRTLIDTADAVRRLEQNGHIMVASEGRIRSRMAELARELRYVKQRFAAGDADRRPYLVRSVKVEVKDRAKPSRKEALDDVIQRVSQGASPSQQRALAGLGKALEKLWPEPRTLAAFQERGLKQGLAALRGDGPDALAVAAETGSGKTEAAALPLIVGALADRIDRIDGVRAILAYPRIRLAANQAQRLAGYLAACAEIEGLPPLTLGLQVGAVPDRFDGMHPQYSEAWPRLSADAGLYEFPFFDCPKCARKLRLEAGAGIDQADALSCAQCSWRFDGWIGSKELLQRKPPALFLPTTDSLHQWLHDPRKGALWGDDSRFAAPSALLADEIHLYTHIHGAQVGMTFQRLDARVQENGARPLVAIGMSATMGDPALAWGRLIGRKRVDVIQPLPSEADRSSRGREYFYFIQPEVESRGYDIAGASTTIQSLMCVAHGMRRRTGKEGGYRGLVFFDSIDKMRRLHSSYVNAEQDRELAAFRTTAYGDNARGEPLDKCCGEPIGCGHFANGECWWFAATDQSQVGAKGLRVPGQPLEVASRPVYSGTGGDAEEIVKGSDIVFATSSLEVGYDDPDIALVYQHYAPLNLASFIQRKGRGGRGVDDRPITATTLSIYSPRDTWWFRRPHEMINPPRYDTPLNPNNAFVVRGQALSAMLDGLARWEYKFGVVLDRTHHPHPDALVESGRLVERLLGPTVWARLGVANVQDFYNKARNTAPAGARMRFISDLRAAMPWAPNLLFDTINLPSVTIAGPDVTGGEREDISLALATLAPGNATRRYSAHAVHWRPPTNGRAPWLTMEDYAAAERQVLAQSSAELLSWLPTEARALLHGVHVELCRPTKVTLEKLGWMAGSFWNAEAFYDEARPSPIITGAPSSGSVPLNHDCRAQLRGFTLVNADKTLAKPLPVEALPNLVASVSAHAGKGVETSRSGLSVAQVYWGADAEVRFDRRGEEASSIAQVFIAPSTKKPLLHGYQMETEGIRFQLDRSQLDGFVNAKIAALREDDAERKWRAAQFSRYQIESGARRFGLSAYEARRGADLIVTAAGEPALRERLQRLLRFWSSEQLVQLFEATRATLLSQHPLMTPRRVAKTAEALNRPEFRELIKETLVSFDDDRAKASYLRSVLLHSLALRLKQSVALAGFGDDRRLIAHVQLPIQFSDESDYCITICEAGSHGDGTSRALIDNWETAVEHWSNGFLSECPNAQEDDALRAFWLFRDHHEEWRSTDHRDISSLAKIAGMLRPKTPDRPLPSNLMRILFASTTVGGDQFRLYDIAADLEWVREQCGVRFGRPPQDWELASAAVAEAISEAGTTPILSRLYSAYASLGELDEGSLSPDARIADQAFRLAAPLCVDGCRGCVHQSSDLMNDSLVEVSTSRRLLTEFLDTGRTRAHSH